jgi:hypothetical protein
MTNVTPGRKLYGADKKDAGPSALIAKRRAYKTRPRLATGGEMKKNPEEKSRASERIFSFRNEHHTWDPKWDPKKPAPAVLSWLIRRDCSCFACEFRWKN